MSELTKANKYGDRIVCGKCGFLIALRLDKNTNECCKKSISVMCLRRHSNGERCKTINEVEV